jgi:hypothetical protein
MTVLLAIIAIVAVLTVLLGLALMSAAKGADELDTETGVLATLASIRSPSGRPFFANGESMQDFVRTLEESRSEQRPAERGRRG